MRKRWDGKVSESGVDWSSRSVTWMTDFKVSCFSRIYLITWKASFVPHALMWVNEMREVTRRWRGVQETQGTKGNNEPPGRTIGGSSEGGWKEGTTLRLLVTSPLLQSSWWSSFRSPCAPFSHFTRSFCLRFTHTTKEPWGVVLVTFTHRFALHSTTNVKTLRISPWSL
jgi:hypothetical protein